MSDGRRPWQRFATRDDPTGDALVEGVPPYLLQSVREWVEKAVSEPEHLYSGMRWHLSPKALQEVERSLRVQLNWVSDEFSALTSLQELIAADGELGIAVIDFLLSNRDLAAQTDQALTVQMMQILEQGGSAWTVARSPANGAMLQQRVPGPAASAASEAMEQGRAGEHIQAAWAAVFGREPNPSYGYGRAVKAVEAAGASIVLPNDPLPTLGKMITALRDKPDKWEVDLRTPSGFDSVGAFRGLLELLWKAQHDRHGTPEGTSADDISQHEAEAAVHLAVTCVLWFTRGTLRMV